MASIREIFSTHERLTIEYNVKEHHQIQHRHLRLCSQPEPEPEHRQIYHRLSLKEIALPRKITAVK